MSKKKTKTPLEVAKKQCSTCPFREGSPVAHVRGYIEKASFLTSRFCHSTGGNRVVEEAKHTSRKQLVCRGSRDLQLRFFVEIGFLKEATDECWAQKTKEIEQHEKDTTTQKRTRRSSV